MDDTLEKVGQDIDEASAKLQAARQTLLDAPQGAPEIRQAVARLERREAELERIEAGIAVREGFRSRI
jgi:hypothetical protein